MLKLTAIGRLTADPETRYAGQDNQTCIVRFTIAVDRKFKKEGQPDADFHNCVAFGKTAEFIDKYFTKGRRIAIAGTLQNNNYTDNNGVKHYAEQIVVEDTYFCDSKSEQNTQKAEAQEEPANNEGFMSIPEGIEDEGLPFN